MRGFYRKRDKGGQQNKLVGNRAVGNNRSIKNPTPRNQLSPDQFPREATKPVSYIPEEMATVDSKISTSLKKPKKKRRRGWNWRGFLIDFVIFWVIIGAGCLVAFILWSGFWLILDPDSIIWINQYLPANYQISHVQQNPPQTLEAIKEDLKEQGFETGKIITLSTDVLVPIVATIADCQPSPTNQNCQKITELRLYEPLDNLFVSSQLYQLKRQLVLKEPEESFVVAPLVRAGVSPPGTNKLQPFTSLEIDPQAPKPGIWLHLTGKRGNILYGQVLHYNPEQNYVGVMAEWTSPQGNRASWQQIHGDATPELVVDRSVGLEPSLQIYQIKPREFTLDPIWLVETNLNKAAIASRPYENALTYARIGLWSAAAKKLQALKSEITKSNQGTDKWSEVAQNQLDFIQLHADTTTKQAELGWANPSQAISAKLIDGRWQEALTLLESIDNSVQMQEVVTLLNRDKGQLGERIRVTLDFNPQDINAQIWAALVLSSKAGKARAITWLQTRNSASLSNPRPSEPALDRPLVASTPATNSANSNNSRNPDNPDNPDNLNNADNAGNSGNLENLDANQNPQISPRFTQYLTLLESGQQ
ncbi:MAG: hypothetical protein HC916_07510 [Coleofasciculaceae cyanobacterium SM2_1_6]|nr:hypothetical protein [Coleofasciculaceae cyanobacterium SM2_1_6]